MAFLESRLGMAALAKNAEAVLALAQADSTPLAEAARRLALQILNRKEVDGCSET